MKFHIRRKTYYVQGEQDHDQDGYDVVMMHK